jgi:pSer/pThr/pTyr-binding forkhead associated (FHA) protein
LVAQAFVIVRGGPDAGREQLLRDRLVVGRSPSADLVLTDPTVSRRHVEVRIDGTTVVVEDLGSSNGTSVDGKTIETATRLGAGEQIHIGSTDLEVVMETGESQASAPTTPTEIVSEPS